MTGGSVLRGIIRWAILIAALAAMARLFQLFWSNLRQWQALRGTDPSAAEIYNDGCLIDGGAIIAVLSVGFALFYGLDWLAARGNSEGRT